MRKFESKENIMINLSFRLNEHEDSKGYKPKYSQLFRFARAGNKMLARRVLGRGIGSG